LEEGVVGGGGGWRRGWLEEGVVGGGGGWRRGWLEEGVLSDAFVDHLSTARRREN
jgi:hypothetical protein